MIGRNWNCQEPYGSHSTFWGEIMPKTNLFDAEKLAILELLAQTPKKSQETIAEETHHRKAKISEILKEFRNMPWEDAKAFCGRRENILALRNDYVDKKVAEAEMQEQYTRANIMQIRHEAGLPLSGHINRDGSYEI